MSVANAVQKGDFDLNLVSLRKPLEFPDNTIQSTAYTGGSGIPTLEEVLTSGDDAQGLDIQGVNNLGATTIGATNISVANLEVTTQIELTPTGNTVNFLGEINQVANNISFSGNQLTSTRITNNSGGVSNVPALVIGDNTNGNTLQFIPLADEDYINPYVTVQEIVIGAINPVSSPLTLTCTSGTSLGVKITDFSVSIGAGGGGNTPTNLTVYQASGTLEYGSSHQFVDGVAQYSNNGNASAIIPSAPSTLASIVPGFEVLTAYITGNAGSVNQTFILQHNRSNSTNYAVFPTIYYGYSGSAGTFDLNGTSNTVSQLVVNGITNTQFSVYFNKGTGDNINIYLSCLVVYEMPNTTYPKAY